MKSIAQIGTLVLGLGMCLCMQIIGNGTAMMALGIVLGVIGIVVMSINYPLYKKILEKGKSQYAFEITQLAKEIVGFRPQDLRMTACGDGVLCWPSFFFRKYNLGGIINMTYCCRVMFAMI